MVGNNLCRLLPLAVAYPTVTFLAFYSSHLYVCDEIELFPVISVQYF